MLPNAVDVLLGVAEDDDALGGGGAVFLEGFDQLEEGLPLVARVVEHVDALLHVFVGGQLVAARSNSHFDL